MGRRAADQRCVPRAHAVLQALHTVLHELRQRNSHAAGRETGERAIQVLSVGTVATVSCASSAVISGNDAFSRRVHLVYSLSMH